MKMRSDRLELETDVILKRKSMTEVADLIGAHSSTVICLAPAERQTKEITRQASRYLSTNNLVVERATQIEIETNNGRRFVAMPASGAATRGYTATLLFVDKMALLPGHNGSEDSYSAIVPMLTEDSQTFAASAPSGRNNLFADFFINPHPDVHRIKVPGTSIPRLATRVERLRK